MQKSDGVKGNETKGVITFGETRWGGEYLQVQNDNFLEPTIKAILESGSTGELGDGKIFVFDIQEAYRIRTGESGGNTLN